MQYLSPLSLLKETLPSSLDVKSIQLARKKMLAELELSPDNAIDINGTPFSRNDIISYFDQLQQTSALSWHNAIAEDKALLSFLENASMKEGPKFRENPLYNDPAFIRWISPYFHTSFTTYVENCLKTGNDRGLQAILSNPKFMTSQDIEDAWASVTNILTNNISYLNYERDRVKRNVAPRSVIEALSSVMGFNYISMITMLPEDRFAPLRDQYAIAMVQTSIYVFNKFTDDRSWPVIWIENAGTMAVSPGVKDEIKDKLEEVNGITSRQEKKKNRSYVGHLIWVIVIIIKIVAGSSFNSSHSNYPVYNSNTPVIFHKGDSTFQLKPKSDGGVELAPLATDSAVPIVKPRPQPRLRKDSATKH